MKILRRELIDDHGRPWTYCDMAAMNKLSRAVAEETKSRHVAVKIGEVNRNHQLGSPAYAVIVGEPLEDIEARAKGTAASE